MKPCIFCQNPRTRKRGEHVWDDWLNREGGRAIRDPSTTSYYGHGYRLISRHSSRRIDFTLDIVCDKCNNEWMSDLTLYTKEILEPSIRRDKPIDLDAVDIATITAFAFMKAAVLDWAQTGLSRTPCISRSTCLMFRDSLLSDDGDIAFPDGLQVWIARYRRRHVMEAQAFTEEMSSPRDLKGYRILVITYIIGSFVFQLLYPRQPIVRNRRSRPPMFHVENDTLACQIWPDVTVAYWPPMKHVDGRTLESFRERFRRVNMPVTR